MRKVNTSKTYSPNISFIYYFIFLLMGLFLQIRLGLYAYDIVIFMFIAYFLMIRRKINRGITQYLLMLWLLIFVPALISFGYQFFAGEEVSGMSYYITYNTVILTCYIIFIGTTFRHIELNYNIVILFISIPIFLSLSMYFFPSASLFLQSLYSVTDRPDRFGGLFGKDANQLGYYSTLLIILSCFLKMRKQIGMVFYLVALSSLFAIVTSGMRSGIFLLIILFAFFTLTTRFKMIRIKEVVVSGLIIAFCLVLFANIFQGEIHYFKERFSLELLYNQALGKHEKHIGTMYTKWFSIMFQNENIFSILFSLVPSWKFPDSFIIFLLANGGFLGFFGFIMFALFNVSLIWRAKVGNKPILFFVLLFNLLIGIKGNFMFNNIGMFLFVFIVMTVLNDSRHHSAVLIQTESNGLDA